MIASIAWSADDRADQRDVADVADDEPRLWRHRPVEAGRQAVEDHDLFACVEQLPHHVAADIAGASGHQDGHSDDPSVPGSQVGTSSRGAAGLNSPHSQMPILRSRQRRINSSTRQAMADTAHSGWSGSEIIPSLFRLASARPAFVCLTSRWILSCKGLELLCWKVPKSSCVRIVDALQGLTGHGSAGGVEKARAVVQFAANAGEHGFERPPALFQVDELAARGA